MHEIIALAVKDLRILIRDKAGFFFVFFFPLIMAVFFGTIFSGGGGGGGISLCVVDEDSSENSERFLGMLEDAPELTVMRSTREQAATRVRRGKTTAYLVVLNGFGNRWQGGFGGEAPEIELGVDPSRKASSGMLYGILNRYASRRFQEMFGGGSDGPSIQPVTIRQQDVEVQRLLPNNAYAVSFPQGIVWAFIGTAATFGVSFVTERRRGTLVRLRMAPVRRAQVLGGKALACFTLTTVVSTMMLLIAIVVFGVRPTSYASLLLAVVCGSIGFVGIMMLVSVVGRTEQSASGIGWAMLLLMSMTGGGMIPLMIMPSWMQALSNFSPVKWLVLGVEGAIWRGFSMTEMLLPCGILLGIGVFFFALGVKVFDFTYQE